MEARAWRLAGGAGAALLVLVALVAWRADALTGGWLLALRLTGLLAVVGLLGAVVLAVLAALRPATDPAVVVRVPVAGAPRTSSVPGRAALVPLRSVLLLAVLCAAPVLVVLVLATAPDGDEVAGASASAPPEEAEPSGAAEPVPQPPSAPPVPSEPSSVPAEPGAGPSPAQLPSEAAAPAVCDQVVISGDSLWSIAAAQLGPQASDADVDARWRALYERNADAVGPDPDLVRPGLQLRTCS